MGRSAKWTRVALASGGAVAVAALVVWYLPTEQRVAEQQWGVVQSYCSECHNANDLAGDFSFDKLGPATGVSEHAELFETVVRKLRGRLMPPPGSPQPEQQEIDALVAWIERSLDETAAQQRTVGYVAAQRLNRAEYARSVKALLGVDIDAADYLPSDIEVDGFTNIASALSVSPAFIEQYLGAARSVAHLAVGEPVPKVASAYFPPPREDQTAYIDGMPFGTRGGTSFTHTFPADGEYRLTIKNLGVGLYPRSLETQHTLVVLVDRDEQFRGNIGGEEDLDFMDRGGAPARTAIMERFANIPLQVKAGQHEIVVTFIERSRAASDEHISEFTPTRSFSFSIADRVPEVVGGIDLIGPFESTGVSRTASRELVFICEPEVAERERECAERIATNLMRRAFRRPVAQSDLDRLMPFYEQGRAGAGGFDAGVELLVTAVLASPDFLYRSIAPASADAVGANGYEISDFDLASRLSFFLWGQNPDDELLGVAAAGNLSQPDVLEAQVQRMLADARAEVLVTEFAEHWLNVDDLDAVQPDKLLFPEFTEGVRQDFAQEIRLFLSSVLLEDKNVQTLLTADYTFVNERLARRYGVPSVVGPQFRRVVLADKSRHGLLGKAAVQMRTSYGDRTSPVLRGAWVLDKLMGTPPTPPPPGVETDLEVHEGDEPTTLRARLEAHRANPTCGACHGVIDPYGLALENFTVTGAWRDHDDEADAPIDASTELPGGVRITGPVELTQALLSRPDQFVQALTEKLMMYALGRELEYYDMPQVRKVVRDAADKDYRFSAIVSGIIRSDAFRMQAANMDGEALQASLGNAGIAGSQTTGE
jgi:mono/diheme cytochrome c family protein